MTNITTRIDLQIVEFGFMLTFTYAVCRAANMMRGESKFPGTSSNSIDDEQIKIRLRMSVNYIE